MSAGPFDNLDKKTFKQAVMELLESEYKLVGSHKVIELIAEDVDQLRYKYSSKNTSNKKLGSLSWVTTSDKNGKPSLGQKIEEYKHEVIELPYITEKDIELKRQKVSKTEHDRIRIERLTKVAKEKGGLLTVEELAAILNRSCATISKRIQEYHEQNDDILPLKGYILDMGRGTTHKRIILNLYENGFESPDIARRTEHDLESVDRYIKDYERVKFLVNQGIRKTQIQHITGRGSSVISQYIDIIKKYHPDIIREEKE
ncbi:MAG: DUF1670 domain-containing protein [Bacillota bacterium]